MKSALLVLTQIFFISVAWAESFGLKFGEPSYGGTGCVAGSANVSINGSEISEVQFEQFSLTAKKGATVRKTCQLAIPVEIPQGYQVAFGPISDIKGFRILSSNKASLRLNQEIFLSGIRSIVKPAILKGPANDHFVISNELILKDLRWSECGGSTIFRVNLTAILTNQSKKAAQVWIDSMNILKSGHMYWRRCR